MHLSSKHLWSAAHLRALLCKALRSQWWTEQANPCLLGVDTPVESCTQQTNMWEDSGSGGHIREKQSRADREGRAEMPGTSPHLGRSMCDQGRKERGSKPCRHLGLWWVARAAGPGLRRACSPRWRPTLTLISKVLKACLRNAREAFLFVFNTVYEGPLFTSLHQIQ